MTKRCCRASLMHCNKQEILKRPQRWRRPPQKRSLMTRRCCRASLMHCNKQEILKRPQRWRRPPDSTFSKLTATAVLLELRKRSKQQTVRTRPFHVKRSKNYSRRIRGVRCFSAASVLHIVQTNAPAHSTFIDAPQRFNP